MSAEPYADPASAPVIDDPTDARLEPFMGLRDHGARQRRELPGGDMAGWFLAEGDTVIGRALAAGHEPVSILVDARRRALLPVAPDVAIVRAGPEALNRICGRPKLRDPICLFVRPASKRAAALLDGARTVAVLEGIVNPTNMGVIARCAAALGVDALLLDPSCCDPFYRRAVRVSMGEVFAIPHARLDAFPGGFDTLRDDGFELLALTPDPAAEDIATIRRRPDDRVAVLLGTEGPGLSAASLAAADRRVRIAMAAGVDSINVGTAAAVAFFALRARD